ADMWIECRNQHEGIVHVFFNIRFDRLYSGSALIVETYTSFANQSCAVQEIVNDYRFEHIQFKVSHGATDIDRYIISHHLGADHRECLALSGIYFSRHN